MNKIKVGDYIRWWYTDEDDSTKSNAGTVRAILEDIHVIDTVDGKEITWFDNGKVVNYGGKM
jgi:hypothetical protein